ncbi:MAG: FliI/YscN family ATPase [Novosphingobium sp.]|jgi:flagellum-specific ATP synthase|nr:FliI/YscN family ATPase [Novosphingobium sp.]
MLARDFQRRLLALDPVEHRGRVRCVLPTHIAADGPNLPLGALCRIGTGDDGQGAAVMAEVVRVDGEGITLSPFAQDVPILVGARVVGCGRGDRVAVGPAFLGRAFDALGRPLDGGGEPCAECLWPLHGRLPGPLERTARPVMVETGIRAIDGLLPLGIGQRIGLFAPSGAGKTTLLGQIVGQAEADIVVICLIGERGREVGGIWSGTLDERARQRSVMIAATSDQSAAMRVRAVHCALAHAEHWRAQGRHVLFLLDSATRLAMAMRELGLTSGEPPTSRGYTPGVFAAMPGIVERCGAVEGGGAITAILTVLSETEEIDDPICEMLKSLLDGHILLSRTLAEKAQFPAIDVLRSVSRQADRLMSQDHRAGARRFVQSLSTYEGSRTLIETALYVRGASAAIDAAIDRHPAMLDFLGQEPTERSDFRATLARLSDLFGGAP